MSMMNKIIQKSRAGQPVWHLIDAKNQIVGTLANQIAPLLHGKHKPTFSPNMDCGDHVVVVNAEAVGFTGRKWTDKKYHWHTGYPGGLRSRTPTQQLQKNPEQILRHAVSGMLPKNKLRKKCMAKLHVYTGPCHPHTDELPEDAPSILA